MTAWADGKKIEFRNANAIPEKWTLITTLSEPSWNWENYEYRIAENSGKTDWRTIERGTPIVVIREKTGKHRVLSYDRFVFFNEEYKIVTDKAEKQCEADVYIDTNREIIWFYHNNQPKHISPVSDLDLVIVSTDDGYKLNQSALIDWKTVNKYRIVEKTYNINKGII